MILHPSVPRGVLVAAYYKGTRPGIPGLYNRLGRRLDHGPYSHEELIFSDGKSASSSFMDDGVRFKDIGYSSMGCWDFLPLPGADELAARKWFEDHEGCDYDLWGNVRFGTNFARDSAEAWFCSEAVMAALGFAEAFRYGPCGSATALKHYYKSEMIIVP